MRPGHEDCMSLYVLILKMSVHFVLIFKMFIQFSQVTVHIKVLQHVGSVPHAVQCIPEPIPHPVVCSSHSPIPGLPLPTSNHQSVPIPTSLPPSYCIHWFCVLDSTQKQHHPPHPIVNFISCFCSLSLAMFLSFKYIELIPVCIMLPQIITASCLGLRLDLLTFS